MLRGGALMSTRGQSTIANLGSTGQEVRRSKFGRQDAQQEVRGREFKASGWRLVCNCQLAICPKWGANA